MKTTTMSDDEIRVSTHTHYPKSRIKHPYALIKRHRNKVRKQYPGYEIVEMYWPEERNSIAWVLRKPVHFDASIFQ